MPGLIPHRMTGCWLYATSAFTCSSERPVRNGAAAHTKGMSPEEARPAPTPTMFCSAIPTLMSRSGNSSRNAVRLLDPTESLQTATMRESSRASCTSSSAKAVRLS